MFLLCINRCSVKELIEKLEQDIALYEQNAATSKNAVPAASSAPGFLVNRGVDGRPLPSTAWSER